MTDVEYELRDSGGHSPPSKLAWCRSPPANTSAVVRDVTERKKSRAGAPGLTGAAWRKSSTSCPMHCWSSTPTERSSPGTARLEVMTGVPAADMIGKGDWEYSLPFYRRAAADPDRRGRSLPNRLIESLRPIPGNGAMVERRSRGRELDQRCAGNSVARDGHRDSALRFERQGGGSHRVDPRYHGTAARGGGIAHGPGGGRSPRAGRRARSSPT